MQKSRFRRIPATIMLALCIGILLAPWTPVYGQAYRVQTGDSLWKISRTFGVSINSIKAENNLATDVIRVGQYLSIPGMHIVERGNTLYLLAQRYGTSIEAIQSANNLSGTVIMIGQRLVIPGIQNSIVPLSVSPWEMELLARTVYSEARGESFQGQVAVAAVVLNRLRHPDFPNTISGVIYEPWAFSALSDGQFWLTPNATAYAAVKEALSGSDPSNGSIFYYNPVTATNQWIRSRPITARIGNHVFAH